MLAKSSIIYSCSQDLELFTKLRLLEIWGLEKLNTNLRKDVKSIWDSYQGEIVQHLSRENNEGSKKPAPNVQIPMIL